MKKVFKTIFQAFVIGVFVLLGLAVVLHLAFVFMGIEPLTLFQ